MIWRRTRQPIARRSQSDTVQLRQDRCEIVCPNHRVAAEQGSPPGSPLRSGVRTGHGNPLDPWLLLAKIAVTDDFGGPDRKLRVILSAAAARAEGEEEALSALLFRNSVSLGGLGQVPPGAAPSILIVCRSEPVARS